MRGCRRGRPDRISYVSPIPSAADHVSDSEVSSDELSFPGEEVLSRAHDVRLMPMAEETEFMRRFSSIVNG